MKALTLRSTLNENEYITTVCRILAPDGQPPYESDITEWSVIVQLADGPISDIGLAEYKLLAQPPGGVVQTSLQTGGAWGGRDGVGYNVLHTVPVGAIAGWYTKAGRVYRVEYEFVHGIYGPIPVVHMVTVRPSMKGPLT